MPLSPLRDSQARNLDHSLINSIAQRFKVLPGCLHDFALVVYRGWHVLYDDMGRLHKLRETCHPFVEPVLRICPSTVIIEIAMALTRGASEQNLHGTHRLDQLSFCSRSNGAEW